MISNFSIYVWTEGMDIYSLIWNPGLSKIGISFWYSVILMILAVFKMINKDKTFLILLGFSGGIGSIIFTNIMGSTGEWGRLFAIIIPFMIISVALLIKYTINLLCDGDYLLRYYL